MTSFIKKVDTSVLPHNGSRINWQASINKFVPFVYGSISDNIKIIDSFKEKHGTKYQSYMIIEYKGTQKKLRRSSFLQCKFGDLINSIPRDMKLTTETGQITIHNCKIKEGSQKIMWKSTIGNCISYNYNGYTRKFKVLDYLNSTLFLEEYGKRSSIDYHNLVKGHIGCIIGVKQPPLQTKYPKLCDDPTMSYFCECLINPYDATKYTSGTTKIKLKLKCKYCHELISMTPNAYKKQGHLQCLCSKGPKYPEKFFRAMLLQLNSIGKIESYTTQLSHKNFSWCGNYRYDFFISHNNSHLIVETHGAQHYINSPLNQYHLETQQHRDILKKELASKNGFTNDSYLEIDCRCSELQYIKKSILNSTLPLILDFSESDINWTKCNQFASNHISPAVIALYTANTTLSIKEIGQIFDLSPNTIAKYLKNAGVFNRKRDKKITLTKQSTQHAEKIRPFLLYYQNVQNDSNNYESIKDIAKKFSFSYTSALGYLKANGIYNAEREEIVKSYHIYLARTKSWNLHYAEAITYYNTFGTLDVPRKYISQSGFKLGRWLGHQKEYYQNHTHLFPVAQQRLESLQKIGFHY